MFLNNLKIGRRLIIGFGTVVLITAVPGIYSIMVMHKLAEITKEIYDHPLAVSNAVRDIRANINAMHRSMKDVALSSTVEQIEAASSLVDENEEQVFNDFDLVFDRFLGNIEDVSVAHMAFTNWKEIRDEVIELSKNGRKDEAIDITRGKGAVHVELMNSKIQKMIDFAGKKADDFFEDAQAEKNTSLYLLAGFILLMVLLGIIISILITRSIVLPLNVIVEKIGDISQGVLSNELKVSSKDEIGNLAESFLNLQKDLQQKALVAEQIAGGDFSSDILPRTEKDELGKSFYAMTTSLRETTFNLQKSEHELSVRNRILEVFSTKKSIDDLFADVLNVILDVLDSKYGFIGYIDEKGDLICPSMTRNVWDISEMSDKNIVFPKENWGGLWGKSLLDRKTYIKNDGMSLPDGHNPLKRALAAPILLENELIGQIVVADKNEDYNDDDVKQIELISSYLAAVIHSGIENEQFEKKRKEAEKALRDSEERYRMLVETMKDGLGMIDNDRKITYANDRLCEMLGYSKEELTGKDVTSLYNQENLDLFKNEIMKRKNWINTPYEITYTRKDGSLIHTITSPRGITGKNGEIEESFAVITDITDLKKAEKQLKWELSVNSAMAGLSGKLLSEFDNIEEMTKIVLAHSKELTNSRHGFVSKIDPVSGDNFSYTLIEMMKDDSNLNEENQYMVFPKNENGNYPKLWGYALNTKQAFFTNNPESHESFKGTPEGHIPLKKFLSVPVMIGNDLVGLIALANSDRDYDDSDIEAINRLGELYALAIQRIESNDALKERIKELNGLYGLGKLTEKYKNQERLFKKFLKDVVPASMQFPDKVFAKIGLDNKQYGGAGIKNCPALEAPIVIRGDKRGELVIGYTEDLPFIEEFEQKLVDGYAERLGKIIERKQSSDELQKAHDELEGRVKERTKELADLNRDLNREIVERKAIERVLQYRGDFDKTVSKISTHFINITPDETDESINYALEVIGEFSNVDRSYLFMYNDDLTIMNNTHEWCRKGIEPQIRNLKGINLADLPWISDKLQKLENTQVTSVKELPKEAEIEKEHWLEQDIQSLIVVPMVYSKKLMGFLGFDSLSEEKIWTKEDVSALKTIGELIISTIVHNNAEIALRESEEQYRQMFEDNRAVKLLIDPSNGTIMDANPAASDFYGYPLEHLKRMKIMEINTLSEKEIVKMMKKAASEKRNYFEFKHRLASNVVRDVEVHSSPVTVKGKKYLYSIIHDITDRKKAEIELEQERIKLETKLNQETLLAKITSKLNSTNTVTDILDEILKTVAKTMNIDRVSMISLDPEQKAFTKLGSGITKNGYKITEPDTTDMSYRPAKLTQTIIEGKNVVINNISGLRKKEREYFSKRNLNSLLSIPITVDGIVSGIVSLSNTKEYEWTPELVEYFQTVVDIIGGAWERQIHLTARVDAEKKRTEAVQTAERALRLASIGSLAAGITHEINQPLNALSMAVNGMLYWEKRKSDIPKDEIFKKLSFISKQAARVDGIIMQMRILARQEKSEKPVPVNINNMINDALSMVNQQMISHNIKITKQLHAVSPVVHGNSIQLEQVVLNIVNNARSALDTISKNDKEIIIASKKDKDKCFVTIKDNGPGIDPENLSKIFDPFFSTKSGGEGMGFGLSIAQNIINKFGGKIKATNRRNGGAEFSIMIPASANKQNG